MSLVFDRDVTMTPTDYGAVLLHQRSGRYWKLNPTAVLVVDTLMAGGDESAAAEAVQAAFAVGSERARQDIDELIATLRAARLVRS